MKKLFIMILMLTISISFSSCNPFVIIEYVDGWYLGVATDMSENDKQEHIVLNIPSIGYVEIPEYDKNIMTYFDDEQHDDYVIQEGDLVYIWYEKESDISILESYPARFENEPDSISVFKQNLFLGETEDGWLFQMPIEPDIIYNETTISNNVEGDIIHIWYEGYIDSEAENIYLCETKIISLSENKVKLLIDYDYIQEVLEQYMYDDLFLSNSIEEVVN